MTPTDGTVRTGNIAWEHVERLLVIKLRSIGDSVLLTPSLIALRRFLPNAKIDVLLEDWVAPVLDGFTAIDEVLTIGKGFSGRLQTAFDLRRRGYDVVFNQHGGTTSTFLTFATRSPHRVGFSHYQYSFLYNHLSSPAIEFWGSSSVHSAEQQLALLGSVGVPVTDQPKSDLDVSEPARTAIRERLSAAGIAGAYALLHPSTAFVTKQWPTENFARVAEFIERHGLATVAVGSPAEADVLNKLEHLAGVPVLTFDDLTLPEITALAANASLFVGNDSGIAHIAAAVDTPSVVVFGSSNRDHWRPWTQAPNEIVFAAFACQPCPGYECKEFGEPRCIREVPVAAVVDAVKRVLASEKAGTRPAIMSGTI
jgi:predicted lipopolysaccharide heptosyltransferase III